MEVREGEMLPRRAARLLAGREASKREVRQFKDAIYRWCRAGLITVRVDALGHYFVRRTEMEFIRDNPKEWRQQVGLDGGYRAQRSV